MNAVAMERKRSEIEDQLEHDNVALRRKRSEIEDQLEQDNVALRRKIAAKDEEIQKLEKQLDLAEHRNSQEFPGGESFLDSGATPHLLNRALERVHTTSGSFTKLLMLALKNHGGIDCTDVAKTLAKSVCFERDAHTKFFYQALVCKVLFSDFENEYFNVEDNAPDNLDLAQLTKEKFQRYKELAALENPEELVLEDATDTDFRRLCNKKRKDLVAALSKTCASGVDDVGALMFGDVYGPEGIRGRAFAGTQYQVKVSSSFVKFVLSVFLVHKLAFALRPIARIFRVREGARFSLDYMEPVVASADSEDDNDAPISLSAGFMVVPGFHVNRITVHSRVYTVKRSQKIEVNREEVCGR